LPQGKVVNKKSSKGRINIQKIDDSASIRVKRRVAVTTPGQGVLFAIWWSPAVSRARISSAGRCSFHGRYSPLTLYDWRSQTTIYNENKKSEEKSREPLMLVAETAVSKKHYFWRCVRSEAL